MSEDESVLSNRTAIRMSVNGEVCQPDQVTTESTIVYHRKKEETVQEQTKNWNKKRVQLPNRWLTVRMESPNP